MEDMVTIPKTEYERLKKLDDDFLERLNQSLKEAQEGKLIKLL